MSKSKPRIIADWDGTLRRGFTIHDWVASLVSDSLLPHAAMDRLGQAFRRYRGGELSHDALATVTAMELAKCLQGISVAHVRRHALEFAGRDAGNWFPFTKPLLSYIQQEADLYVISGAPDLVVAAELAPWVPEDRLFCLSFEHVDNRFTGHVKTNPGTSGGKGEIVRSLVTEEGSTRFALALGNADSDRPLFDAAEAAVIVENHEMHVEHAALRVDANTPISEIVAFISGRIDAR